MTRNGTSLSRRLTAPRPQITCNGTSLSRRLTAPRPND